MTSRCTMLVVRGLEDPHVPTVDGATAAAGDGAALATLADPGIVGGP